MPTPPRTDGVYRRTLSRDHTRWWSLHPDGSFHPVGLGGHGFSVPWVHRLADHPGTWTTDDEGTFLTFGAPGLPGTNRFRLEPDTWRGIEGAWFEPLRTVTGILPPTRFFRFEPLTARERKGSVVPLVDRIRAAMEAGQVSPEAAALAERIGEGVASKVLGRRKPRRRAPTARTLRPIAEDLLALGPQAVVRAVWGLVDRGEEAWPEDAAALLDLDRTDPDAIDPWLARLTAEQPAPWTSAWDAEDLTAHLVANLDRDHVRRPDPFGLLRVGLSGWLLGVHDPLVEAALPVRPTPAAAP